MLPMTDFFHTLPARNCCTCNDELVEMADCYNTVCDRCNGSVYYPLSPVESVEE